MKETDIRVLMVEPGKHPNVTILKNSLKNFQQAVSIGADYCGLIEVIPLENDICLLCNEEGKLLNLPANRRVGRDIIAGVFYVCKENKDGDLCSLNDEEVQKYRDRFWEIEHYLQSQVEESLRMQFFFG